MTLARSAFSLNALNPANAQPAQSLTSSLRIPPPVSCSPGHSTSRRGTPSSPQRRISQSRTVRSNSRSSMSSSEDVPATSTATTTRQRLRRVSKRNSSPGGSAVNRTQGGWRVASRYCVWFICVTICL